MSDDRSRKRDDVPQAPKEPPTAKEPQAPEDPSTPNEAGQDDVTWVRDEDDVLHPATDPEKLADALRQRVAGRRGWQGRLEGASVFSHWEAIVGKDLAGRCEPVRLAGGHLVVRAPTEAWATQVRYLTAEIVRRAGQVLRPGLVQSVDVVVGEVHTGSDDRSE